MLQVLPIPRHAYDDATLNNYELVADLKQLTPEDWDDYYDTVVRPHVQEVRPRGQYRRGGEEAPGVRNRSEVPNNYLSMKSHKRTNVPLATALTTQARAP